MDSSSDPRPEPPDEPYADMPPVRQGPPEEEVPRARFCKRCGGPLAGGVCPNCEPGFGPPLGARPARTSDGRSRVVSALGLYFALLISFVFLAFSESPSTILFVDGFDVIIVLVWVLAWRKELLPILRLPSNHSWMLAAPLIAVGTFLVTSAFVGGVNGLFEGVEEPSYSEAFLPEGWGWFWVVLSVCIQPALMEEFAFRGVIFQAFRRVMSEREVLVVTALLFAVLHISPLALPTLFMMGWILGWMRLRSGSIWPCVLLHFCHNGLVVLEEAWGSF